MQFAIQVLQRNCDLQFTPAALSSKVPACLKRIKQQDQAAMDKA